MDLKYQNMQHFEQKISLIFWLAFTAGVLHKAVTWVGGAALTWATVVLIGGFASDIPISDFFIVILLVLIIIILLTTAIVTSKLVTKKSLSTGSLHPLLLTYSDKRLLVVNVIKSISFVLQCSLIICAFRISASKIRRTPFLHLLYSYVFSKAHVDDAVALASLQACLQSCTLNHHISDASALQACVQFCVPAQNSTYTGTTNLYVCLFTFHALVSFTCLLALLCNAYIFFRIAEAFWLMRSGCPKTLSLMRYHDEVLSRALHAGLVEADEFDSTEFLLRVVGEDLAVRNIAPLEVKRQNEDFIKYLFYCPTGVEMVMGMLASDDSLLQQTAANMPGFWSLESKGMEKVLMELLSALGEKLGMPGKVAEGAANSFKALAMAWKEETPSPLLRVYVSRSGNVPSSSGQTDLMPISSISEAEGREGSGTRELCGTGATPEGSEGQESEADGCNGRKLSDAGKSVSALAESDDPISIPQGGAGSAKDEGSDGEVLKARGGGGGGREGERKWNVVQKVVDLVTNKRLPTLQAYVRALDAFFMSESVKESLTTEEREQIKGKLLRIVQGNSNQVTANTNYRSVVVDSSAKARTRLLAFSALDRLGSSNTWRGQDVLQQLDELLKQVPERFVIWIDEVDRYKELCDKYSHPPGDWLSSGNWETRGQDFAYRQ